MGTVMTQSVLQTLRTGGIRCDYGYPGGKMPEPESTVAAVNLLSADLDENRQTVLVQVLTPAKQGATACEAAAMTAAELLHSAGGSCKISQCTADERTGLYCVPIQASFTTNSVLVRINGQKLNYAVGFTATKETFDTLEGISVTRWKLRLEEFFPEGVEMPTDPAGSIVIRVGTKDSYSGCNWIEEQRNYEAGGLRRIRTGIAPV